MSTAERERWHRQTKVGGGVPEEERGDCVPACITSILGLPLEAMANTHGERWWDRLQEQVGRHGYALAQLDLSLEPPPAYWIAQVPSLNLGPEPNGKPAFHSVVAHGYELIHDPSLRKRYDDAAWTEAWNERTIAEGWALVPRDPACPAAHDSEEDSR
jgi:hypothetical protein